MAGLRVVTTFGGETIATSATGTDGRAVLDVAEGGELTVFQGEPATLGATLFDTEPGFDHRVSWWWNSISPWSSAVEIAVVTTAFVPSITAGNFCPGSDGTILLLDVCRYPDGSFSVWGTTATTYGAAVHVAAATTSVSLSLVPTTPGEVNVHGISPNPDNYVQTSIGPLRDGPLLIANPSTVVSTDAPAFSHTHSLFLEEADALAVGVAVGLESTQRLFRRLPLAADLDIALEWALFPTLDDFAFETDPVAFHLTASGEADFSLVFFTSPQLEWVGILPPDAERVALPELEEFQIVSPELAVGRYRVEPPIDSHLDISSLKSATAGHRSALGRGSQLPY